MTTREWEKIFKKMLLEVKKNSPKQHRQKLGKWCCINVGLYLSLFTGRDV